MSIVVRFDGIFYLFDDFFFLFFFHVLFDSFELEVFCVGFFLDEGCIRSHEDS